MDPSTYTANRQAPRSRYVFIAGADTAGCWLATDYNAGATWGLPDVNTQSTNAFYTSFDLQSWRLGPIPAPWAPRAAAALTSSGDRRTAWLLGGMQFTDGSPSGATFSDAYSISAAVCLYGDNGQVCSGAAYGTPNLQSVSGVLQERRAPLRGTTASLSLSLWPPLTPPSHPSPPPTPTLRPPPSPPPPSLPGALRVRAALPGAVL